MNDTLYSRTASGDVVPQGVIYEDSWTYALLRLPRRLLPKTIVENPGFSLVVTVLPFGVWAFVGWWLWKRFRK